MSDCTDTALCCQNGGDYKVVAEQPYNRSAPGPTVRVLYHYKILNSPGKSAVGLIVEYPPGGASAPHRHGTASIAAVCIEGAVYNKMNTQPTYIIPTNGSFYEAPGCHHACSANASETEPAKLLATIICDTKEFEEKGPAFLVINDPEYQDVHVNVIPPPGI